MCMILLEKKILSFPSIKKWLDLPGSYKNSTGQKTSNARQQEARKNLIDLLTSGMSNLTCYYFSNPRNIQLSAVTSVNLILESNTDYIEKRLPFFPTLCISHYSNSKKGFLFKT